MKGLFIPGITSEMFRNGCLESIEALMAEGEIYDIEYSKWIPVSERLPEEEGDYLLWGKVYEDEEEYQFIGSYDSGCEQFGIWEEQFDRTTLGCLGSEFFEYASVVAWMPLPEPYKESEDAE